MPRRALVIIAASLAVLSTFESALCFAAAVPAPLPDDAERPRFLKKEIKRFTYFNNSTSTFPFDRFKAEQTSSTSSTSTTTPYPSLGFSDEELAKAGIPESQWSSIRLHRAEFLAISTTSTSSSSSSLSSSTPLLTSTSVSSSTTPTISTSAVIPTSTPTSTLSIPGVSPSSLTSTAANVATTSTPQSSPLIPLSTPSISTPQLSTPLISTPLISTPLISTPLISTPSISTPSISTPLISSPEIPSVDTTSKTTSPGRFGGGSSSSATEPQLPITTPSVSVPGLPASTSVPKEGSQTAPQNEGPSSSAAPVQGGPETTTSKLVEVPTTSIIGVEASLSLSLSNPIKNQPPPSSHSVANGETEGSSTGIGQEATTTQGGGVILPGGGKTTSVPEFPSTSQGGGIIGQLTSTPILAVSPQPPDSTASAKSQSGGVGVLTPGITPTISHGGFPVGTPPATSATDFVESLSQALALSSTGSAGYVTLPGGVVVPTSGLPAASFSISVGLGGGSSGSSSVVGVEAGGSIPQSITSNGILVSNPAYPGSTVVGGGVPASITSNGVLVSNPAFTGTAGLGGNVPPSITSNGVLVSNPAYTGTVGQGSTIPASITSNGVVVANPAYSSSFGIGGNVPASITSNGAVIANPAYTSSVGIGGNVPASITSNGAVIANPAYTSSNALGGLIPPSLTSNGVVYSNPLYTPPLSQPAQSQSLPNGGFSVSAQAPGATNPSASFPVESVGPVGSTTLSNGQVVPIFSLGPPASGSQSGSSPVITSGAGVVGGSQSIAPGREPTAGGPTYAQSPTEAFPQQTGSQQVSGQLPASSGSGSEPTPVIVGSTTNSLGQVVPLTSIPPSGNAQVTPSGIAGASASVTGQPAGSTTLPNGSVVPLAHSASNAATASGSAGAASGVSQSLPSQSGASGTKGAETNTMNPSASGAATGISASSVPESPASSVPGSPASTAPGAPSSSASPLPIATASQTYDTSKAGPFTQKPTGYDTMTAAPIPSSILQEPSSSSPTATTGYGPTGLPTGVPLILYPPGGQVKQPVGTDLIQIGFLYPLNYDFVWRNEESQRQIFHYLPIGITYGLDISIDNCTMQTLRAYDTTQDLHYVTTLSLAWVPSNLVDELGLMIRNPVAKFYDNPDPSVKTLLSMINTAIPIRADNQTDGGFPTVGATPSQTGDSNNGAPIGNGVNNDAPVRASSVGIGVGVVCGAAAYGAAMFFVARRYKKRKQSHMRSPSAYGSPVMSHAGPDPAAAAALMSGGMGERSISPYYDNDGRGSRGSGRSGSSAGRQQISAPVMAENSLGWN